MKTIFTLLLILFFFSVERSFAQLYKVLGCADNYGVQNADGTLPDDSSGALGGCFGHGTTFKQVYWQFFYSPSAGEFKQAYTPIGNNNLDLDYIVYDLGSTRPGSLTAATSLKLCGTEWSQIICNNDATYDLPTGPGQPGRQGNLFITTASHYYAIAIIFWQSGTMPYSLSIGAPTLNTGSGDRKLSSSNCNLDIFTSDLLSFEAKATHCMVDIDWMASAESNLEKYEIQSSEGNEGYSTITTVAPAGVNQKYHLQHIPSSTGDISYRLKMVNRDGSSQYSKEVVIKVSCNREWVKVYPNPVKDKLNVNVGNLEDNQTFTNLFDSNGRLLYSRRLTNGTNSIDLKGFSSGIYLLTIKNHTQVQKFKIVK